MGAEAPATSKKDQTAPPSTLPLPPALFLVRARSRVADLGGAAAWASGGPPDTPPRRSPVTVPFRWEEAPGKPKAPPPKQGQGQGDAGNAAPAAPTVPVGAATDHGNHSGGAPEEVARPVPLKLPPRLQRVVSAKQQQHGSLSPKAMLHGPYYYSFNGGGGGKEPPRRTTSGFAAFRRTPSAGVGRFSWSNKKKGGGRRHDYLTATDAPWCSPTASSASSTSSSSSSSISTSCFGDDHRRPADAREDGSSEEEDECGRASVRITRLRRNRSFPSMTTAHLWVCHVPVPAPALLCFRCFAPSLLCFFFLK